MANEKQLALLKRSIKEWNEWRKNNLDDKIDLSQANLSDADFSDADLRNTDLSNANLSNAHLSDADFSHADLSDADLSHADLFNADLFDADLSNAHLNNTHLSYADLSHADLSHADLSHADLSDADLSDADLSHADLSYADLSYAYLSDADLFNGDLSHADLSHADLFEADLIEADLSHAYLIEADLSDANLRKANLSEAYLIHADLSHADLSDADLSEADLFNADLSHADLSDADLSEADLSDADLRKANLTKVKLIECKALQANFKNAILTAACIQDWHINSETNFENVICDYIYLKYDQENNTYLERRPSDENKFFAEGEFKRLIETAKETVDLIFNQGIDWSAFLTSFNNLRVEDGYQDLSIQAIEHKDYGILVVKINTANVNQVDKGEIEKSFRQYYQLLLDVKETQIKLLNSHNESLQQLIESKRQENTKLLNIVEIMAEKDNQTYNDFRGANIGGGVAGKDDSGDVTHNHPEDNINP